MSDGLITALTAVVMVVGLISVAIPVLPDMAFIWLAALGYGLLVGWGEQGPWLFALITLLGLIGAAIEVLGSSVGGKLGGASLWSILGGFALGVVGLIFFTPVGGVVGLLPGTFLVEYWRSKDARQAARGTLGMGLGFGASFVVKFLLALGMVAAWVVWAALA